MNQNNDPDSSTDARRRLRILSYNIQIGIASSRYRHYVTHSWKHVLPYPDRHTNLNRVGRFIRGFDIVGLQEVDAGSMRSDYVNQADYLASRAHFPYWYCQTNRKLGKFAQHGLGLLGRYQPHKLIEHRLPGTIPGRGALEARFGSVENPLIVIQLHLSLGKKARARQIAYVARMLETRRHVIVMGDFNCRTQSAEMETLMRRTHLCESVERVSTYPSWRPARRVDHIFVTPELIVDRARVFQLDYSDHLPISMELILPDDIELAPTAEHAEPMAHAVGS